jgi:hypothetical protein
MTAVFIGWILDELNDFIVCVDWKKFADKSGSMMGLWRMLAR